MKARKCEKCGNYYKPRSHHQKFCFECYNSKLDLKEVKGGNLEMARVKKDVDEKEVKNPKTPKEPKEPKEKKVSVSDVRIQNAEKLDKFLTSELKLDDVEKRKVMSNLYHNISKRLPKKAKK